MGYTATHFLINVRLILGFSSVLVAGGVALWDRKVGFFEAFNVTAVGVAVYIVLSAAYLYWVTFVEKGVVYEGSDEAGENIQIVTKVKDKYSPVYTVVVKRKGKTWESEAQFMKWFGINGLIEFRTFEEWFANVVKNEEKKDK